MTPHTLAPSLRAAALCSNQLRYRLLIQVCLHIVLYVRARIHTHNLHAATLSTLPSITHTPFITRPRKQPNWYVIVLPGHPNENATKLRATTGLTLATTTWKVRD
jgi:hypothetical protein